MTIRVATRSPADGDGLGDPEGEVGGAGLPLGVGGSGETSGDGVGDDPTSPATPGLT